MDREGALALFRESAHPLAVFQVQDAVTGRTGYLRQVVVGVTADDRGDLLLLRDEQVLDLLNRRRPGQAEADGAARSTSIDPMSDWLQQAREHAARKIDGLRLPFRKPLLSDLALFWPEDGASGKQAERWRCPDTYPSKPFPTSGPHSKLGRTTRSMTTHELLSG